MKIICEDNLKNFSKYLPCPLYIVGGYIRNFLIDGSLSCDIDLCAPIKADEFVTYLKNFGGQVVADYKRTGTVVFKFDKQKYEFTAFRKDGYTAGVHTPDKVEFTTDILEDALRRDFKCNAIYYDVKNDKLIDLLGGLEDIKNRVLDTVKAPEKVFCHDGLRLLRLARFTGELGFTPTEQVLLCAKEHADNILDISAERIWAELNSILVADKKYNFSDKQGHYTALKVLSTTRVLDRILPEIAQGRGMVQRADFHKYDVLEHSLKCVLYAPEKIRLYALLHDVGKPYNYAKTGLYYGHDKTGATLCKRVLQRLKADKNTTLIACRLTALHMADIDGKMRESKVRKLIVKNFDILDLLLAVKQADYSACRDDLGVCPTVKKWKEILAIMQTDGTPFSLKDLKIDAKTLMDMGYKGEEIGQKLTELFDFAINHPEKNQPEQLKERAKKDCLHVKSGKNRLKKGLN